MNDCKDCVYCMDIWCDLFGDIAWNVCDRYLKNTNLKRKEKENEKNIQKLS